MTFLLQRLKLGNDNSEQLNYDRSTDIRHYSKCKYGKVLQSAVANAEHNFGMDTDKLKVVAAMADNGPVMKRFRPVSMGWAHPFRHRTSHITVVVAER